MTKPATPPPPDDDVMEASEESFPASDPPAFASTTGSKVHRNGSAEPAPAGRDASERERSGTTGLGEDARKKGAAGTKSPRNTK